MTLNVQVTTGPVVYMVHNTGLWQEVIEYSTGMSIFMSDDDDG